MSDNINIKIKGIDPARHPNVANKKYIDVFFELSEKAAKGWCVIFNDSFVNNVDNVRINPEEGDFVETWVRDMEEIPEKLNLIKETTKLTNTKYMEKLIKEEQLK